MHLYLAKEKAMESYNKIAEEIQKLIVFAINKLNDLEKFIKPNFKLCEQDFDHDGYTPFNQEKIKQINLALTLIKNY